MLLQLLISLVSEETGKYDCRASGKKREGDSCSAQYQGNKEGGRGGEGESSADSCENEVRSRVGAAATSKSMQVSRQ